MDFDHDPREVPGRDRPTESRPPHDHQALFSARLVVGIVIVFIGVILLADNLGWFEARYVLRGLCHVIVSRRRERLDTFPALGAGALHVMLLVLARHPPFGV